MTRRPLTAFTRAVAGLITGGASFDAIVLALGGLLIPPVASSEQEMPKYEVRGSVQSARPLPHAWRYWRYSRVIELPGADQPRLVSFVVPVEVYAGAQAKLRDLRVIDDQGRETPYLVYSRSGASRQEARPARFGELSFVPGQFTLAVLDLGEKTAFHNAVKIETPDSDFIVWVEVAASDDARTWRILRDRAPISRFRKEGLEGNQTVRYPETNARYLRLRVLDGSRRFTINSPQVFYHVVQEPERMALRGEFVADAAAKPGQSLWRAQLDTPQLPVAEVVFQIEQPEFYRAVRVSSSTDGQNWVVHGSGEIYRYRQGEKLQESLRVPCAEVAGRRYWRVEVVNGNDPPLAGARPSLQVTPRRVVFRQEPGRTYRLLYSYTEAPRPHYYELPRLTHPLAIEMAVGGTLGTEELNSAWADPRPWTERHPVVLWVALVIAVGVLGFSALHALRRPV